MNTPSRRNRLQHAGNASRLAAPAGLVLASDDELRMVEGGSVWGWIKGAARWVKNHVFVDFGGGKRVGGIKGRF